MAFAGKDRRRVQVFYSKDGKQCRLPRAETKHLDGQPQHNIDAWVRHWELVHEIPKPGGTLTDADWLRHLETYLVYLEGRGKRPSTLRWHRQMLRDWVLPYFVSTDPVPPSIDFWRSKSARLLGHMQAVGAGRVALQRAVFAARRFWQWMCEEGMVQDPGLPLMLRLPRAEVQRTPLSYVASPDDILNFVAGTTDPTIRFIALAGYFGSLRTFEVFALRPQDFLAGTKATVLDDAAAMRHTKLYDRLAIHVHRERTQNGEFHLPKMHSAGYVSCFNERAARLLLAIMQDRDPTELVVPARPDWLMKHWRKNAHPRLKLTIKDLRRASLAWLGHHTPFMGAAILLQKHARHSSLTTTQLYLRRPEEPTQEWQPLDLDA